MLWKPYLLIGLKIELICISINSGFCDFIRWGPKDGIMRGWAYNKLLLTKASWSSPGRKKTAFRLLHSFLIFQYLQYNFHMYVQVKLDVGPPYGPIDVKVDLPCDYPFKPPTMAITSRIFHPNVYKESGLVCMRWFLKNQSHNSWSFHHNSYKIFKSSALDATAAPGVDAKLVWSPTWHIATLLK